MKIVKTIAFGMLVFFAAVLNSEAYRTQLDYNYQVKDFKDFKQYVGKFSDDSKLGKQANSLLDENGYLHLSSMCKYSYEKSCFCYPADNGNFNLDAYGTGSCFCFKYPLYKNNNYASIYIDDAGGISVAVSTHGTSELQVNKVAGSYKYLDIVDADTSSFISKLELFNKKISDRFDIEINPGDMEQIKDFFEYGYCPSSIVINPTTGNDSSTTHEGFISFGKYGLGIPSSYDALTDYAKLYTMYNNGTLTNEVLEKMPYIYFNDAFNLTSQGTNAFSLQDKQYIDNVI